MILSSAIIKYQDFFCCDKKENPSNGYKSRGNLLKDVTNHSKKSWLQAKLYLVVIPGPSLSIPGRGSALCYVLDSFLGFTGFFGRYTNYLFSVCSN